MTHDGTWETRHDARGRLGAHRHQAGYAALVLEGHYDERSVDGRFACGPGTVVVHPPHHLHVNDFGTRRVRVLNVPLPDTMGSSTYRVVVARDPGYLERVMRADASAAAVCVASETLPVEPADAAEWLADMAAQLRDVTVDGASSTVAAIARSVGRTPEYASRAFTHHFGVGPCAYRREYRLRIALTLMGTGTPISAAASAAGFADQSHLGRELKRATGLTPRRFLSD